jgi:hypothetical protein
MIGRLDKLDRQLLELLQMAIPCPPGDPQRSLNRD